MFLTPWPQCIGSILETNSLVIVGTKDNGFGEEHINIIKNKDRSKIKVIEDANHDLEKDDFSDSIELLNEITQLVYDFIK